MDRSRLIKLGKLQKFDEIQGIDYGESFFSYSHAYVHSDYVGDWCILWLWNMENGCKDSVSKWDLEETIYISQPEGFMVSGSECKSRKLLKSIYGLKQDSISWNKCFDKVIKYLVFIKT